MESIYIFPVFFNDAITENLMKHINTLFDGSAGLLSVKAGGTNGHHSPLKN